MTTGRRGWLSYSALLGTEQSNQQTSTGYADRSIGCHKKRVFRALRESGLGASVSVDDTLYIDLALFTM